MRSSRSSSQAHVWTLAYARSLLQVLRCYDFSFAQPFFVTGNITLYNTHWPTTTTFYNVPGLSISDASILVRPWLSCLYFRNSILSISVGKCLIYRKYSRLKHVQTTLQRPLRRSVIESHSRAGSLDSTARMLFGDAGALVHLLLTSLNCYLSSDSLPLRQAAYLTCDLS